MEGLEKAFKRLMNQPELTEEEMVKLPVLTEFAEMCLEAGWAPANLSDLSPLEFRAVVAAGRRRQQIFIAALGACSQSPLAVAAALAPLDEGKSVGELVARMALAAVKAKEKADG